MSASAKASAFPKKADIMCALIGSGFILEAAQTKTNYLSVCVARTEQLGVRVRYLVAFTACRLNRSDVQSLVRSAEQERVNLVIVGEAEEEPVGVPVLTYDQFFDRLGGPIFSLLPFEPAFSDRLAILGANALPKELKGRPDDLFEQYVHAGLQFLFRSRVVRYGQERRGEPVPDGISLGSSAPLLLYDAKAATDGYKMSMDAVRQFSDYVKEFHKAYGAAVGRLSCFLVISGSFADDEDALEDRSQEVRARCDIPLAFLDATTFGAIVGLLVRQPLYRQTVDWSYVFGRPVVRIRDVERSLTMRQKDGVFPAVEG